MPSRRMADEGDQHPHREHQDRHHRLSAHAVRNTTQTNATIEAFFDQCALRSVSIAR